MDIERINTYDDPRFPAHILKEHGAFLADGKPVCFAITSARDATLYHAPEDCRELIDTFRFYAPHITRPLRLSKVLSNDGRDYVRKPECRSTVTPYK